MHEPHGYGYDPIRPSFHPAACRRNLHEQLLRPLAKGDALAGSFGSAHSLNRPSRLILGKFITYSIMRLTDGDSGPHLHTS